MGRIRRYGAIMVMLLSVVSVVVGIVFIVQGVAMRGIITEGLQAEKVTLGIEEDAVVGGEVIDTAGEAQVAANTLIEHLRERYGTYADTARGSPERATYLDGLTLLNSLNQAVMGFGLTTVVIVSGVLLVVIGFATGTTGVALSELAKIKSRVG